MVFSHSEIILLCPKCGSSTWEVYDRKRHQYTGTRDDAKSWDVKDKSKETFKCWNCGTITTADRMKIRVREEPWYD